MKCEDILVKCAIANFIDPFIQFCVPHRAPPPPPPRCVGRLRPDAAAELKAANEVCHQRLLGSLEHVGDVGLLIQRRRLVPATRPFVIFSRNVSFISA